MFKGVSLDQAPPFEAPLLFFLTAVIYGILGGLFLIFSTNFNQNIATLHLFSLGFMANIMFGAFQQMLPVVVGVKFDEPKKFSKIVYFPFNIGIIFLFATLFFNLNLSLLAAILLGFSIFFFTISTLKKLFRAPFSSPVVWGMRLSLISLITALSLAVVMLIQLKNPSDIFGIILPLHALFASFGWIGLLIIAISYQVIPMFYVTYEFSSLTKNFFIWSVFISLFFLVLPLISLFADKSSVIVLFLLSAYFSFFIFLFLNGVFFIFAISTLLTLFKRKRAIKEPSISFWQFGLFTLLLISLYPITAFFNNFDQNNYAIIFGYGFAISVIYGMLYKIIPFLSWFHISSRGFFDIPTTKEMIDEKLAYLHLIFHITATLLLIINPKAAAMFIVLENILFAVNIKKALKVYFEYKKRPSPMEQWAT